jgi:hypothetical protein
MALDIEVIIDIKISYLKYNILVYKNGDPRLNIIKH